jgi:AraC family transcriptional regulator
LAAPVPSPPSRRLIRPFEVVSQKSFSGSWFVVESQLQDVSGRRAFDVQFPTHQLTLTPDGPLTRVAARIDGGALERFPVQPGQLTLLPSGQRIRGYTEGHGTRGEVRLFYDPELVGQVLGSEVDPSRFGLVRSMDLRNPNILRAMAALRRELEHPGPMGRAYVESLVVQTVAELVRCHSTLDSATDLPQDLSSRRLRRVIDYIEAHLGEDLALLTLGTEVGVSPAHLARGFKSSMGRSVHQHVLCRRVERAAVLLAGTEQSIAQIALATGFSSQAHLTTAFQRLKRTTPAAYRRRLRG